MEKITRAQKSEQTRKNIVDTSRNILRRDGFKALTISRICKEAGVSNGTFYHFFESKQDLISAVFPLENILLLENTAREFKSPLDVIEKYVSCYADYYEQIGAENYYRIVFLSADDSIGNKTMYMENRPIFRYLKSHLGSFKNKGVLKGDTDIDALCRDLIICEIGTLYWACTTGQDRDAFRDKAYSILSQLLMGFLA